MSVFDTLFKTSAEEEEGKEFYIGNDLNPIPKKTKGCITLIVRSQESEHYKRAQLEVSAKLSSKPAKKGFRQKKQKDVDLTPEETSNFMKELVASSLWVGSKGLFMDDKESIEAGATFDSRLEALKLSARLQELITYLSDTFLDVEGDSDKT